LGRQRFYRILARLGKHAGDCAFFGKTRAGAQNQGWIQEPGGGFRYEVAGTKFAAKAQYTFRF
jgi:hypothetical protein